MENIRLNKYWIIGIQGLIMLFFGIAALANPEVTLLTITRFFGAILLLSGIILLILTKTKESKLSEFWFYEGIANIIIGFIFLILPALVTNIFIIILGLSALIVGVRNLWITLKDKAKLFSINIIRNSVLIAFGLLFLFVPFESAKVIIKITGLVALLYGILTLYVAYKYYQMEDLQK